MTRGTLHNSFGELLMNIQAGGGQIGVTSSSPPHVSVPDQQIDTVVVTNLKKLDRVLKQKIESAGLVIDSIDLEAFELVLVPGATGTID